jgi:hypothetical protein
MPLTDARQRAKRSPSFRPMITKPKLVVSNGFAISLVAERTAEGESIAIYFVRVSYNLTNSPKVTGN